MAINSKNGKAEKLARQVRSEAADAVICSPDLEEILMAISRRCSSLPDLDTRSAEEIVGYDEKGTFARVGTYAA